MGCAPGVKLACRILIVEPMLYGRARNGGDVSHGFRNKSCEFPFILSRHMKRAFYADPMICERCHILRLRGLRDL